MYFKSNCDPNIFSIKTGAIVNYEVLNNIDVDDDIYDTLFSNLKFSGFACSDLIIVNGKIIIFEINPRIGGSLIANKTYFNIFLDKLSKIIMYLRKI